ncbi:hypothetical protein FRB90_011394 [Tulasnella sp. 427]|nr:hypothetical protein FRB90_011394 [Tulasnella sp. 427]
MADKATASKSVDQARRTWNKEEYTQKAKQKDDEERERMKENEDRMKKGKKPRRHREELPKATELLKQREGPLELEKNQGKSIVVQSTRGPGAPGFFCEICNRTSKDSAAYLNHINGRQHLRRLGQTTTVARSTIEQVRARIAFLREKTKEASKAKSFDFDQRLREIREKEQAARAEEKAKKKADKEVQRMDIVQATATEEGEAMAQMMGFAGFGSSKK